MSAVLERATACWPDGTPKSMDSGFVVGFKGTPHGYVAGAPAAPSKPPKQQKADKPFNSINGTISGMGSGKV